MVNELGTGEDNGRGKKGNKKELNILLETRNVPKKLDAVLRLVSYYPWLSVQ